MTRLRSFRRLPSPTQRRGQGADHGFTMLELAVSIVILGLVMAAITAAMFTMTKVRGATKTRIDVMHDAQVVTSIFGQDIASGTAYATSGSPSCGSLAVGESLVLNITGATFDIDALPATPPPTAASSAATWPAQAAISYVSVPVTISGVQLTELHRRTCTPPSSSPYQDQTVARQLLRGGGTAISCQPACSAARTVTLTLTSRTIDPPVQSMITRLIGTRRTT